ncbi:MAG: hypothetical protein JW772_03060 [Candidatus Diapherotrites archaeon]|nr:hypothetical protein [Candidatus Diapherotrites archaeon]
MADFFLTDIIFSSEIITWAFFIIAYAILGGGVKYIDDAFDEKTFRLRNAVLIAPLLGIFWAYAMTLSEVSCTILGAIVIAVFLKGKIDNIAHQLGILSIFFVLFIFGLFNFLWIPLIILVLFGLLDEFGNDYIDKHLETPKPIWFFFEYRFSLKIAVLAFVLLGTFPLVYFFAFLAWDLAYAGIMRLSTAIAHSRKFYYYKEHNSNGFLRKGFGEKKK